jgi:hypothetical protein
MYAMDVAKLDRLELRRWLLDSLHEKDLGGGRICEACEVRSGRLSDFRGWKHVGTAGPPVIRITNSDAAGSETLAAFLATKAEALVVVKQVDGLLLRDAAVVESPLADCFGTAFHSPRAAIVAVLLSERAGYEVPDWAWSPPAPPIFATPALAYNEVVFIHRAPKAIYGIEPIADIVFRGHEADLLLKAEVVKPENQARVPMTLSKIVI